MSSFERHFHSIEIPFPIGPASDHPIGLPFESIEISKQISIRARDVTKLSRIHVAKTVSYRAVFMLTTALPTMTHCPATRARSSRITVYVKLEYAHRILK